MQDRSLACWMESSCFLLENQLAIAQDFTYLILYLSVSRCVCWSMSFGLWVRTNAPSFCGSAADDLPKPNIHHAIYGAAYNAPMLLGSPTVISPRSFHPIKHIYTPEITQRRGKTTRRIPTAHEVEIQRELDSAVAASELDELDNERRLQSHRQRQLQQHDDEKTKTPRYGSVAHRRKLYLDFIAAKAAVAFLHKTWKRSFDLHSVFL